MNANNQTYSNLYRSRLSRINSIQFVLSILTFIALLSVYLYGASILFSDDVAYFLIIILLSVLTLFKLNTKQYLYWFLRPKLNIGFFHNFTTIITMIFSSLCLFLILINSNENEILITFGLFGSITFMLGLPIIFYIWLTFKNTNQKVSLIATNNTSKHNFSNVETYLVIISIAVFGIIYDFIPQKVQFILWYPLFLLILIGLINFIINYFQIRWIVKAVKESRNIKPVNTKKEFGNSYEDNPYRFEKNIKENLIKADSKQRVYILNTLKQIVAIDMLPVLIEFQENYDTEVESAVELQKTIENLQKTKNNVLAIQNTYEFVEQANDTTIIKGLIRLQLQLKDKNLVIKLLNDNRNSIKSSACIVAGYFDDINFISILISHLQNPSLSMWSQFALKNIGIKAVKYLDIEFTKRKSSLFFVEACFEVLSDIDDTYAHNILFKSLNEVNKNINLIASKKIIEKIKNPSIDKRKYFGSIFDDLIITQITNSFLINEIENKNETFYQLRKALENENKNNIALIKSLIKLYYDENVIETLFSYYGTNNLYEHAFCNHLIDEHFKDNLSALNKIKALFSPKDSNLIENLEEEFPYVEFRKKYSDEESLIWSILKLDYDRINNWTRACAINTLQYLYSEDIPFDLAAEFINKDKLLKETAAICIYRNIPEFYTIFLKRLPKAEATKLDFVVRSNVDYFTNKLLREDNLLLYNKIQFLLSLPYFKELSINELNTFEPFFKVKVLNEGSHTISRDDENLSGYWIVENGDATYSDNGINFKHYSKRDIFQVMPNLNESGKVFFKIKKPTRFLIIDKIVLLNILKKSHDIILKNIEEYTDFYSPLQVENLLNEQVA